MNYIEEFVDERKKEIQRSRCIHCGKKVSEDEMNFDHVPSKCLLQKPYPTNLPVVKICMKCNKGFSPHEEYLYLFLNCVLAGSTDSDQHHDPKVARALNRHQKLSARIDRSKVEYETLGGERKAVWKQETERINRVILKNARGHAFYEYSEHMLAKPAYVWSAPLETMTVTERAEFEDIPTEGLLPEVGTRGLTRALTGKDLYNNWVVVQDGVYRYSVVQQRFMTIRSVLFDYLATEVYWNKFPPERPTNIL